MQLLVHAVRYTLAAPGATLPAALRKALAEGSWRSRAPTLMHADLPTLSLGQRMLLMLPARETRRAQECRQQLRADSGTGSYEQQLQLHNSSPYPGLRDVLLEEVQHSVAAACQQQQQQQHVLQGADTATGASPGARQVVRVEVTAS
jgi:hypothetical protein